MESEILNKCLKESFFSGYYDIQKSYLAGKSLDEITGVEKEILLLGWFADGVGEGLDSFLYSSVANHIDQMIDVLKKIGADYILVQLSKFADLLNVEKIPQNLDERFTLIDRVRNEREDDYWNIIAEIDEPILFGDKPTVEEIFVSYYQTK